MIGKLSRWLNSLIRDHLSHQQIQSIRSSLSPWQERLVLKLLNAGRKDPRYHPQLELKRKLLNLGFTEKALADLKQLARHGDSAYVRRLAAWELCVWYANQSTIDYAKQSLKWLPKAVEGEKSKEQFRNAAIVEAECFLLLGESGKAKRVLEKALAKSEDANLYLAMANIEKEDASKLMWINKALKIYDISSITFDDAKQIPLYDRLSSIQNNHTLNVNSQPLVTVIMPVYNAENVIRTSLESVLNQSWTNLEIIVVDDCSTDQTKELVEEYSQSDHRVKLIRTETNSGPYVARNLALSTANGEYVTCNDGDDWSHPQKIEKQVRHLMGHPKLIGNTSEQARASTDLVFNRRGNPGYYIFNNMSSFMFRREPVLSRVGYWDSVRFGADSEYIRRIRKVFGHSSIVDLATGPLSFQRFSDHSLTGNEAFGYHGFFMGARKEYFEASQQFHEKAKSLYYTFPQVERPFAVPEPMWPKREVSKGERRHFDMIIASDFRLAGGSNMSNIEEIKAQKQMGFRTGLIQMHWYDTTASRKIVPQLRELLDGDKVQMLVYGEHVSCDLLVLRYPPVLQEWQRFIPDVEAKEVRVIINQPPMSDYGPEGVLRYDLKRAQDHLEKYFGKKGVWHPIGPMVREALHRHHASDLPYIQLSDEDWVNIINVDEWRRTTRPPRSRRPRIGRHSRDHVMKWPDDPATLRMIYPDTDDYEVHILGGASTPKKILGRLPKNWRVVNFGKMHPKDFLADIDVFVYYTHPDWVESFGRVVIEAMAVGVPVILPHSYRTLFADAAIYAEPSEVKSKIDELMEDEAFYEAQVETALRYVEQQFGYMKHRTRIDAIISNNM